MWLASLKNIQARNIGIGNSHEPQGITRGMRSFVVWDPDIPGRATLPEIEKKVSCCSPLAVHQPYRIEHQAACNKEDKPMDIR